MKEMAGEQTILIKFDYYWTDRLMYKERRQLKELKGEKIFFNEDLTKENGSLFYVVPYIT